VALWTLVLLFLALALDLLVATLDLIPLAGGNAGGDRRPQHVGQGAR
jgi:hypothetical protein